MLSSGAFFGFLYQAYNGACHVDLSDDMFYQDLTERYTDSLSLQNFAGSSSRSLLGDTLECLIFTRTPLTGVTKLKTTSA
jgi:hypothetical protein